MSTEIDGRVSSGGASRLPEMFDPPPNGITTASASSAAASTAATCVLAAGRTTTVRKPADLAAPVPHKVAQALAAGVDDAVHRVGGHVLGADGGRQTL